MEITFVTDDCVFDIVCARNLGGAFYSENQFRFEKIAVLFGINSKIIPITTIAVGVVVSFYFVSLVISYISVICAGGKTSFGDFINKFATEKNIERCIRIMRALIFICFLGLIMSAFSPSIWLDEAYSLGFVKNSMQDVVTKLPAIDMHPQLYYILLKLTEEAAAIFSTSFAARVTAAKLLSVLAYILTALLCRYKCKENKTRGLSELLILCLFVTESIISYGVEIRMYSWAVFFVAGAFLYAWDIVRKKDSIRTWMIFVGFSLCSAYTHHFALISVFFIWFYLLIWMFKNKYYHLKRFFGFGIVTIVCYLPGLFALLEQTARGSSNFWIGDLTIATVLGYVDYLFPCFLLFLPVIIICFIYYNRMEKGEAIYSLYGAFVTLFCLFIGVSLSLLIRPLFTTRYMIPSVMCLWITVMMFWCRLQRELKAIVAAMIVAGCVLFGTEFMISECCLAANANDTLALVETIQESDVVVVEYDDSVEYNISLLGPVSSYIDTKPVYLVTEEEYTVSPMVDFAFSNICVANMNLVTESLNEGKTVYYITFREKEDFGVWETDADSSFIGNYTFGMDSFVYKISRAQ